MTSAPCVRLVSSGAFYANQERARPSLRRADQDAALGGRVIEAISRRRSQYALGNAIPLGREQIEALVKEAVRQAPSSFNSQSSRAVILFGSESKKLWSITSDALRAVAPADGFEATEQKIASFAAGAGTVLFFEDTDVVKGLQESFPLYWHHFPIWSEQSSGMAQFAVWTALAEANIGASLQHYNPLIDDAVAASWGIPASWFLRSQMPFGSHEATVPQKTFIDDEVRFKVF